MARAQSPEIQTTQQGCDDFDRGAFGDLLELELETIRSELPARPSRVFLECSAGSVRIHVALQNGSAALERRIAPRGAERALKTRLLALTVSELLALLWRKSPPVKARATETRIVRDVAPDAPPAKRPRLLTYAAGAVRSMFEPRTALFGGALGMEYELSRAFALGIDVDGLFGTVESEHATVALTLGSVALHGAVGARFGDWVLRAGPGTRVGWAHLSPADLGPNLRGHDVSGAWAGPLFCVRTSLSLARLVLTANAEAGVVALPVVGTVDGATPEVELRGAWFGVSAGVGVQL